MGRTREAEPPEDERRPEEGQEEDGEELEDERVPEEPRGDPSEPEDGEARDGEAGDDAESFSRSYVEKLRKEAAQYRTRLKEIEDAGKSESEKLAEERDTLRADNERLRTRVRRSNFIEKVAVSSPRLAWAALQDLSVQAEWDDKDQVSNLPEVRKALKKEFPEDFGDRGVNGGDTGQAPASSDMNARIRAATGR